MIRPTYLALVFAAAIHAPGVASAYCIGADDTLPAYKPDYYALPVEFDRVQFVVEAEVVRETWVGEDGKPRRVVPPFGGGGNRPWGLAAPYLGAWYDLKIVRSFKGRSRTRLRLFSENSTARFWLNKGERYLLFMNMESFDPPVGRALTIDNCGNSAESAHAPISEIRRLATQP